METEKDFNAELKDSLDEYTEYLNKKIMPHLRESFSYFQSIFENVYNYLIRKAIIKEDPYKYDQNTTEITIPPNDPLTESEKKTEMSHRLSMYHSQLEVINNFYQFSIDFLNIGRLKKLANLLKYINWANPESAGGNSTTAVLLSFLDSIKQGNDKMAAGIVTDSQQQLRDLSRNIAKDIKAVSIYHREKYKLEIREKILERLKEEIQNPLPDSEETMRTVKRIFIREMNGTPFYPELVKEVLMEDFSTEGSKLKTNLLERLKIREQESPRKKKKKPPLKEKLFEALRILSSSSKDLLSALAKLDYNLSLLEKRKLSLTEKIRKWILKSVYGKEEGKVFEIEYLNEKTGIPKREKLNYTEFTTSAKRLAKLLINLQSAGGPIYKKLEASSEETVLDLLVKKIGEMGLLHKRMEALNTYFLSELPRNERENAKGIKIELSAIKNSIIKANKKRYEYVSTKEEQEQLKKLGIKDID